MSIDIIILLAFVALAIISSVTKIKAKAKKAGQPKQPGVPTFGVPSSDEDPWENLRKVLEIDSDVPKKGQVEESVVIHQDESGREVFSYDKQSLAEIEARQEKYLESVSKRVTPIPIREVPRVVFVEDEPSVDDSALLKNGFDIRAAILYSEILKPKFEE